MAHRKPSPARSMSISPTVETPKQQPSASSYFSYPVKYAVAGVLRRLSTDPPHTTPPSQPTRRGSEHPAHSLTTSPSAFSSFSSFSQHKPPPVSYTPPRLTPPFSPPPLTPLTLKAGGTSAPILSRALAEEIRLLVPTRLELVDTWALIYGLELHGASLATLYDKCEAFRGKRGGFVVVVRDGAGNVSGLWEQHDIRPSRRVCYSAAAGYFEIR